MQSSQPKQPKNISDQKKQKKQKKITQDDVNYADKYHNLLFKRENTRMFMKKWFFWTILAIYILLILLSLALFILAGFIPKENALFITIASIVNLVSTNIALPLIIAKNLFQATENDNLQLFFDNYVKVIQLSKNLDEKSPMYTYMVNEKINNSENEERDGNHVNAAEGLKNVVEDDSNKII